MFVSVYFVCFFLTA